MGLRVVSLVPSLSESVLALAGAGVELVGRTAWCIHPRAEMERIPAVGGTKNASLERILDVKPDLVLFEREENPRELHERVVEAGLRTLVTHVLSVDDVPSLLETLGEALDSAQEGRQRADELRALLASGSEESGPLAVPLIWHEPLMALSVERYGGDLLRRAGFRLASWPRERGGYPTVSADEIGARGTELLLLTSEPHDFSLEDGEQIARSVAAAGYDPPRFHKVDGEALTWFGVRTAESLGAFRRLHEELAR